MLKDYRYDEPGDTLIKSWEGVVDAIITFVNSKIVGFVAYYKKQGAPSLENRVTDLLVQYLEYSLTGYEPYRFSKNPTSSEGRRETDIGVFPRDLNSVPLLTIFEFEAKRLSRYANNNEYVYGERGGMERYKAKNHAPHLSRCGMLGYVLDNSSEYWFNKINEWIETQSQKPFNSELNWRNVDERLIIKEKGDLLLFAVSKNKRIDGSEITVVHYLLDLSEPSKIE